MSRSLKTEIITLIDYCADTCTTVYVKGLVVIEAKEDTCGGETVKWGSGVSAMGMWLVRVFIERV